MTPSPLPSDSENQTAVGIHGSQAQMFRGFYEALADDRRYETSFHYGRYRLQELLDEWIPPHPERNLLDVGCGTGHHLKRWSEVGHRCAGVDAADEMLAEARSRNPGMPIEKGTIYEIPFESGRFDLAVSIEVLRYLVDVPRALAEVARVLQPGGEFIGTVMSPYSLCGYPLVNLITGRLPVPGFVRLKQNFHSQRAIDSMLRGAGFSSVEIVGLAFVTAPQKVVERLIPSFFKSTLEALEPADRLLSRFPALADLALHLVFRARK